MKTIETLSSPLGRRVYNAIQCLGYTQLAEINCAAIGSKIILRGVVSSFYLKQVAQTIAVKIPGVHGVENRIVVQ